MERYGRNFCDGDSYYADSLFAGKDWKIGLVRVANLGECVTMQGSTVLAPLFAVILQTEEETVVTQ